MTTARLCVHRRCVEEFHRVFRPYKPTTQNQRPCEVRTPRSEPVRGPRTDVFGGCVKQNVGASTCGRSFSVFEPGSLRFDSSRPFSGRFYAHRQVLLSVSPKCNRFCLVHSGAFGGLGHPKHKKLSIAELRKTQRDLVHSALSTGFRALKFEVLHLPLRKAGYLRSPRTVQL